MKMGRVFCVETSVRNYHPALRQISPLPPQIRARRFKQSNSSLITIKMYFNFYHHISVMQLDHLLTRSGLTYPEVSSKAYHDSFCQLDSSVSLPWVNFFETFYLHIVSSLSRIPLIRPKIGVTFNSFVIRPFV